MQFIDIGLHDPHPSLYLSPYRAEIVKASEAMEHWIAAIEGHIAAIDRTWGGRD
jgi:hypothetical protein